MNTEIHRAGTRGKADHGWLQAKHSFSFANYYNPNRMGFGALRVLNDDVITPSKGFGTHPHDNMEIITIPLKGSLKHKDSMGNGSVIEAGEIQMMSAGTGIYHSEHNASSTEDINLFQIWIHPNKKAVKPRYDQQKISDLAVPNKLYQVLSPSSKDQGVWIYQEAWFHMGNYSQETTEVYQLKGKNSGLYIMIIEGSAEIDGKSLAKRDAMQITDAKEVSFSVSAGTDILVLEVPLG